MSADGSREEKSGVGEEKTRAKRLKRRGGRRGKEEEEEGNATENAKTKNESPTYSVVQEPKGRSNGGCL